MQIKIGKQKRKQIYSNVSQIWKTLHICNLEKQCLTDANRLEDTAQMNKCLTDANQDWKTMHREANVGFDICKSRLEVTAHRSKCLTDANQDWKTLH